MWVREQPPASSEVVDDHRWATFQENYFKRIDVLELLQRQRSVPHLENNASSEGVTDAASSLLFFASGSSIGGSHISDDLERVFEIPKNSLMW
jgi:hypothetical protein